MIDILAIGAHPDDVELCAAGTLIAHKKMGFKTGILDLTRGEMGTRGTPEIRDEEAKNAGEIMDLDFRDNMGFKDAFFKNDDEHKIEIVKKIRQLRPNIVLANAEHDRHPDHGKASQLVEEAVFWAGLAKIETDMDGQKQEAFRPKKIYHFIQSRSLTPDFYVDISDHHEQKVNAYLAYKSQLFDANSKEPQTYISSPEFLKMLDARDREFGHRIGTQYAEGFTTRGFIGLKNLGDLTI